MVFGSLFLHYVYSNEEEHPVTFWKYYEHPGYRPLFGTLIGLVLLIGLARLALTDLSASKASGAVLALIGATVVQRVGAPYHLADGEFHLRGLRPYEGYWAAVGGALIIVVGGLITALGARRATAWPRASENLELKDS